MMRVLISKDSRKKLFNLLMELNKCKSIMQLAQIKNIPFKTLQKWIYNEKRYIPESIIPSSFYRELVILDKKEDNWGKIKGGQVAYRKIVEKYGQNELKKRRSAGGKKSRNIQRERSNNSLRPELFICPDFLEFYGVLLGDGWIGKYTYKNKNIRLIGISGHIRNDKLFFIYLKKKIYNLFNRSAYIKERPKYNSAEILFSHEGLFNKLSKEFKFPVGKKKDLKLPSNLGELKFNLVNHIIRGIFDTDGSFYFDKTPLGNPYPCISLTMKSPILMEQIYRLLIQEKFKAYHYSPNGIDKIILKGRVQLKKWMKEIGSSNPYKFNKINEAISKT